MKKELQKAGIDGLYQKIVSHIENARNKIMRTIDAEQIKAYWLIGRDIVEEEQAGKERADYGVYLIKELADRLNKEFGKGFSLANIKNFRQFYLTYVSNSEKSYARSQFKMPKFKPHLGWTHYRSLMRVSNPKNRLFYEIEASKNNWSTRELDRQIGSLLFDRLAKSKDKKGLMGLVYKGQELLKPEDAIKEPMVLEFLNIPESHRLVESKLEDALINNMQKFILELGRGFAFVARQKRITLDGDNFYCDLVFTTSPCVRISFWILK